MSILSPSTPKQTTGWQRVRQITTIIAKHGLHQILEKKSNKKNSGEEVTFGQGEKLSTSYATRFRLLLEDLGTTFIKFGQVLSTRPDLLSPDIISELAKLQDHCPPMSEEETKAQLAKAYDKPLEEIFAEFDMTPIASASISQVHKARLKNGDLVAVKIERPELLNEVRADIDILYYLARLLEAIVEASGFTAPQSLVKEFEDSLLKELDFRREVATIKRFYENAIGREGVVIPQVYDELCRDNLIVMEFIEGYPIREVDAKKDPELARKLANLAVDTTLAQVFEDGLYHADPHPGNLLVMADGRIGLLDFGAAGELTPPCATPV